MTKVEAYVGTVTAVIALGVAVVLDACGNWCKRGARSLGRRAIVFRDDLATIAGQPLAPDCACWPLR